MWSFILCVFPFFPFLWIPTELIGDLLKHSPFFGAPYTVQTLLRESWSGSYGDAFLCGVFRFSTCQHGFSLGIPASDGESLAPASDDVRLDGLCSWKLCTTGIWYMTHQTPPPNNLKIKLKLSKIRKKKAKKADKTNVLLYYSTSLCCLFGSFLLKVNLRLGLLLRENLKTPHRRTSAGRIPASTFCTI